MWKRGEIAPKEQFLLFSTLFNIIFLTSGVKLHICLLNVVVQFIVFLTLSTLICRGTDISKCFSDSLGIRDNKSRLYIFRHLHKGNKLCDFQFAFLHIKTLITKTILFKYTENFITKKKKKMKIFR